MRKDHGELVSTYLLQDTPMKIMVVLFYGYAHISLSGDKRSSNHSVLFPGNHFLIVAILGLCLTKFDIDNLRPVLGKGSCRC